MNVRIMTKKRKKISVGVLMLAVMFMFLVVGISSVKAEEETVPTEAVSTETATEPTEAVQEENAATGTDPSEVTPTEAAPDDTTPTEATSNDTTSKTMLSTPQNVSISDDWVLTCDEVPEAHGYYHIDIFRDGEHESSAVYHMSNIKNGIFTWKLSQYVSESGTYSFVVTASKQYDPDSYENSAPAEPVLKNYVKPEVQLGTTVGIWDKKNPGTVVFDSVKDAQRYEIRVLSVGTSRLVGSSIVTAKNGDLQTYDVSRWFEKYGAGQYVVTIRALSGNLDEIANGVEGEASDVFDTSKLPANIIENAISNTDSAEEALDAIIQNVQKDTLGLSMQTNDKALEQMKTLEEKYTQEKGITVTKSVSEDASKYVVSDKVSMVGAGLNADTGNISLDISVPKAPVEISGEHYAKSVQLDIKLVNEDTEVHELKVPVTITIPVPQGLEAKHLILFHYHGNGKPERVVFKENGDGTVTFTVKDFSVFVFAQNTTENETVKPSTDESGSGEPDESEPDAGNKPVEPGDEGNGNETDSGNEEIKEVEQEEEEAGGETTDALKSPKTSDSSPIGLYCVLLMVSLMVIVLIMNDKKKRV